MSLMREIHGLMVELLYKAAKDDDDWVENLGRRYDEDGHLVCYYCGRRISDRYRRDPSDHPDSNWSQGDHVFPASRGGSNVSWNIVETCYGCNQSKSDRWLTDWLALRMRSDDVPDDIAKELIARLLLVAASKVYHQ